MIVRFSPQARADIQSIHGYIALENPAMAGRVVGAIEVATSRLAQFPLLGRMGAVATTRELVIPRLPYIAVYRVNVDIVEVIAVFHAAQDRPRGWEFQT
jgi:toxin ParE1/3/4